MLALQDDAPHQRGGLGEAPAPDTADAKAEEYKEEPGETEWVKKKSNKNDRQKSGSLHDPGIELQFLDSQKPLFLLMNKFLKMSEEHWRRKHQGLGTIRGCALEKCPLLAKLSASTRAIPPDGQLSWKLRSLRCKMISCRAGSCFGFLEVREIYPAKISWNLENLNSTRNPQAR